MGAVRGWTDFPDPLVEICGGVGAVGEVTRAPSGDRWGLHRFRSIRREG